MRVMKLFVCLLGVSLTALTACTSKTSNTNPQQDTLVTVEAAPQILPVTIQTLNGYFLKNTYKLNSSPACILFADQAAFDNALGVAKTMKNKIDEPDFVNNLVAAVALEPVKQQTEMAIVKAEKAGEAINVYVEVKQGKEITYTMQPFAVFSLPKEAGVSTLNFLLDGEIIQSFPLNVPAAN